MGYKVTKGGRSAREPAGIRKENAFQTFEDLEVYQVAREFRKKMYAMTRQLPDFEKFELASSSTRRTALLLPFNDLTLLTI